MEHSGQPYLERVQRGLPLTLGEQATLALQLALPSILSQLTTILMQYIDASMVGSLGATASAAIGLVSTSTWLMGGICSSMAAGFAVLVAHSLGARNSEKARHILRQAILFTAAVALLIALIGVSISPFLPHWLGGGEDISRDASLYFFVYALSIPLWECNYLFSAMLRSAGDTRTPSIVNIGVCILNVAFNYILIFMCHLGVLGAAIGTLCAAAISAVILVCHVTFRGGELKLVSERWSFRPDWSLIREALLIGIPMAIEHIAMCSAHIVSTVIVAPLGTAAIAANAFGITIEGLCYMPGYGIGDAATTLVGQSIGAKRPHLQRSFGYLTLALGVAFMTVTGAAMYAGIPYLIPLMTPDMAVQHAVVDILRIEAFAEPMYAASIVIYGIFVGAGDTKMPCVMNLASIWFVRLPLAMVLVKHYGLVGFWIAMATELCFRGLIFIIRLLYKNKQQKRMALD